MRLSTLARRCGAPGTFLWLLDFIHAMHRHGWALSSMAQGKLDRAIGLSDPELARKALAQGADPSAVPKGHDPFAAPPLGAALLARWSGGNGALLIASMLLDAGAKPDTRLFDKPEPPFTSPLREAIRSKRIGEPCMLRCLRLTDLDGALLLLRRGADPYALDGYGLSCSSYCLSALANPNANFLAKTFLLEIDGLRASSEASILEAGCRHPETSTATLRL